MDGPQSVTEYQRLISEIIKQQILLLGKDIALTQARGVQGFTVADDGTVTTISAEPRDTLQKVIDAYFVFSGMIVKKAMEALLKSYPGMANTVTPQPVQQPKGPETATNPPMQSGQTPAVQTGVAKANDTTGGTT